MQRGFVKTNRDILETDLWHDVTAYRLYTYLLLKATHQEFITLNGIELKKGQWVRSYRKLAQDLAYKEGRGLKEYSLQTIKKSIDKLVKMQKIEIQQTEVGTLFTVVDYALHQGFSDVQKETVDTTTNEVQTNSERIVNNNKKAKNAQKNAEEKNNNSRKQAFDAVYYELSEYLFKRIILNYPEHKKPNLEAWCKPIQLMIERDGRTPDGIRKIIEFAQSNAFWKKNILSTEKLRKQYDTLSAQMMDDSNKVTPFRQQESLFTPSLGTLRRQEENSLTEEELRQMEKDVEAMPF